MAGNVGLGCAATLEALAQNAPVTMTAARSAGGVLRRNDFDVPSVAQLDSGRAAFFDVAAQDCG